MFSRLFVAAGAALLCTVPLTADAFFSSSIVFNITFPAPIDNVFGFAGPLDAFDPEGAGGHIQTQSGGFPTYTTTLQVSANATPVSDLSGSNAATISAHLGNLSNGMITETFSGTYSYTLQALADTAQDAAVADIFIQVLSGGATPNGWKDVFDSVASTATNTVQGTFKFSVDLPPNSVTALLVKIGIGGEAISDAPPTIPPPPPPPVQPTAPLDPIPEPSFFPMVAGVLGGFYFCWRRGRVGGVSAS